MIRASIWITLAALASTAPATATVRSLFVGINAYDANPNDPDELKPLSGPVNDVALIKAALSQHYGVDTGPQLAKGRCDAVGPTTITLINECATRQAILDALDAQIDAATAGDQIIFFFAGHGSFAFKAEHTDGQVNGNSTILPQDARVSTANRDIYDVELRDRLYKANRRGVSVISIFDSCSSGTATRDLRNNVAARSAKPASKAAPDGIGKVTPLPEAGAYLVHFAAVADEGVAVEARFGPDDGLAQGEQMNGVFTRALALALAQNPGRSTYRDIAERTRWNMARLGAASPPLLDTAPLGQAVPNQQLLEAGPNKLATLKQQAVQVEGKLDTPFLGGGQPLVRTYLAANTSAMELVTPNDGFLAGITRGSRFTVHCSRADAGAGRAALAGDAVVTDATATTAKLQLAAPLQGCAGAKNLGIRETHHSYSGLKLAIGLAGSPTGAEESLFAAALDGADALVRNDATAPYYLRIETGDDRCDPAAVSRTGSFRAADDRLILCLGATDSPVFERRLGEIVRAAANYHAVAALAAESTAALATIRFLNDPACPDEDPSCTYTTGGNNRVAPGGKLFVDVTATDSAVHAYALLLDGRNFRIQPLNGADNAVDAPIDQGISRRLFDGQFGAAGNLDILVLVTPTPLSLAALHQQPVRAVGGQRPSALERLLASAGQGRRDAPEPVPETWNARLTHFTIGATK